MFRRISTIELVVLGYLIYFAATLFFSPTLFESEQSDLYKALIQLIPSQSAWVTTSSIIALVYIVSMFVKHHFAAMIVNTIGGAFSMMLCITYMFVYPNLGTGIFLFVSLGCFYQVFKESNRYEHEKAEVMRKEINSKGKLNDYEDK
ncbi:hypothetical protein [Staphylococcus saprophyticus]|nr:hypothetical protein [Staphylococcus nepalensis]